MKWNGLAMGIGLMAAFLWLSSGAATTGPAPKPDAPPPIVFHNLVDGEKLSYEAGWNGIPAASATIATRRVPGEGNFYEVRAYARTENIVARLWRMRNTVKTTIEADPFRPVHMYMKQDEKRKVSTREADFVHAENTIKVRRGGRDNITLEEFPLEHNYDPVSASFLFRSIALDVGETIEIDICDGKGVYRIRTSIEAREDVRIGIGTFPAYRASLTIEKRLPPATGPDQKKKIKSVRLWISADPARIPLRLESSVFIGYVYMELTDENRGLRASRTP